jgi:hypothetical protein
MAGVDVVCSLLNMSLRTLILAFTADDEDYSARAVVQFYGNQVGKALNAAAHLISHPKAKAALIVGASGCGVLALAMGLLDAYDMPLDL